MSCNPEINIGLLIEGNAYFGAFNRYMALPRPDLESEIDRLQSIRSETYSRFIKHRTVTLLGISCSMLIAAIIAMPVEHQSPVWIVTIGLWSTFGVMPMAIWMNHERADMFNALQLLKREIKMAKAARATKT